MSLFSHLNLAQLPELRDIVVALSSTHHHAAIHLKNLSSDVGRC